MPPTSEERVQRLIARGLLPSDAEAVVRDVNARNGQILSESEAELLAIQTDVTAFADRLWVMYSVDIPDKYRRLWSAQDVAE